jgi:hypothetical protein
MVPTHYAANPKLGRWVHTQRHQRRLMLKNKKSCMTQQRVDLLDQLGFSWELRHALVGPRHSWQQRAGQLKDYHIKHSNFMMPPDKMPDLWRWAHEQKVRLYNLDRFGTDATRIMKTKMTQERVAILKDMGFTKDVELAPALDGSPPVLLGGEDESDDDDEEADAMETVEATVVQPVNLPEPSPMKDDGAYLLADV